MQVKTQEFTVVGAKDPTINATITKAMGVEGAIKISPNGNVVAAGYYNTFFGTIIDPT